MHNHRSLLVINLLGGLITLLLAGCVTQIRPPATGPDGYSFGGTAISFTPHINFINATEISYTNTDVTSPFPAVYTGKPGTYTYVPDPGFTSGTLTLFVGHERIALKLSDFTRDDIAVTGFTARYEDKTFPVTVTGNLPAFVPDLADNATNNTGLVAASAPIPIPLQGSRELTFLNAHEAPKVSGSRYDTGDKITVNIGAHTLQVGAKPLASPQNPANRPTDYIFKDGNLWYQVYGDRPPLEIAVYGGANPTQPGAVLYGSFSFEVRDAHRMNAGSYFGPVILNREGIHGRGPHIPDIAKGNRFSFSLSTDRLKLFLPILDGKPARTVPLDLEKSSKTNLYYTNQESAPANYVTVNIALEGEGKGTPVHAIARYTETAAADQIIYTTDYIIGQLTRQ